MARCGMTSRMATKRRTIIPKLVRDAVLDEFSHRCAICGADRPHLHHIDENPSNNEPANLLPLCPNHHLTDQHNPTRRHESGKLRIFRTHKDPSILKPQFQPIYDRLAFLFVPAAELDFADTCNAVSDLVAFIAEFQSGSYYANKLRTLLHPPQSVGIIYIPGDAESEQQRDQDRLRRTVEYQLQISAARDEIVKLIVELLRYQNWK